MIDLMKRDEKVYAVTAAMPDGTGLNKVLPMFPERSLDTGICESHLAGRYSIEVIDLLVNPKLAAGDQILAVPTLVRKFPTPIRKIIGDLSNEERVLVGLDVKAVAR